MSQPRSSGKRARVEDTSSIESSGGNDSSTTVACSGGGGAGSSNVIDREIPSSAVLKEMVNKSFRSGDHFSQWRGKYMKTFAVSYTQSLLQECVSEFVGSGSVASVSDIRMRTEEHLHREITDLCQKKPSLKIFCDAIVQCVKEDLASVDIQLPLRKFFIVGSIGSSNGESGAAEGPINVRLFVPFALYADLNRDMMLQWSGHSPSYFEAYKKICGLIQTMSVFQCTDSSQCRNHVHREFYAMLRQEGALRNIVQLNFEMNKHELDILLNKKRVCDAFHKDLEDKLRSSDAMIDEYTKQLDAMRRKVDEVVSASDGFVKLLGNVCVEDSDGMGDVGDESCEFVVSVKRLFDARSAKLVDRLEKEKEAKKGYEAALSESCSISTFGKRNGGGMGAYSMLIQRIHFYESCCNELQLLLEKPCRMEALVKVVELEFKEQLNQMDFMFSVVSSSSDNVKCLVRWFSKVISSQPMVFEGLFDMTEGVRRMLMGTVRA